MLLSPLAQQPVPRRRPLLAGELRESGYVVLQIGANSYTQGLGADGSQ